MSKCYPAVSRFCGAQKRDQWGSDYLNHSDADGENK